MEEEEIPLKEFSSKFRDKEEDSSDLEEGDLEKVVATDFADNEVEETASRDWGGKEDKTDEDSLEEVVTIPSKSVDKEDEKGKWGQKATKANEELKKVNVRNIVNDSFGELKTKKALTLECDMPSDSSDVSLEEVCTIPNFIVDEEKWETADEESEDEDKMDLKAEEIVEGYSGGNMRGSVKGKVTSHEVNISDSFEFTRTILSSFIGDEKETEKDEISGVVVEEESEWVQKNTPTQESGSSSDSSEVSLEEIPSNFIKDDEEEEKSHADDFRNNNLETIEEEEEIFDEESGEESVIRFPPEEEIEAMDEIPLDDTEAEGEESIIEEREPRLSFYAVVRLIVAVRKLRNKYKKNSVLPAVQPLEVALNLGYYFLVVPFKIIVDKDGKFKIHVNPWQMAISFFILLLVTIRQIVKTSYSMKYVTLQYPEGIVTFTDRLFTTLMILAFLFIIGFKRAEIQAVFDKFDLKITESFRAYELRKYKLTLLILIPILFYMGLSNWNAWGLRFYYLGITKTWIYMFEEGVEVFSLPTNDDSKLYFAIVVITIVLANIYAYFFQYYLSILMWSASIAVLNIVQQADHLFGRKGCFNLKKDNNLFKVIVEMVKKVSAMIGPLIVILCLEIIPNTIMGLYFMTQVSFLTGGWIALVETSLKLGHILIACAASSKGSKLVKKIDDQIDREPVEIFQIKAKMRILRKMEWNELINEFTRVTAEPISLTGMELFTINVQFLGTVALAVFTNGLLFAQLIRDAEKDETKFTCPDT